MKNFSVGFRIIFITVIIGLAYSLFIPFSIDISNMMLYHANEPYGALISWSWMNIEMNDGWVKIIMEIKNARVFV